MMADTLTAGQRSILMSKIKSKNSKPELRVRRYLHSLGLRYRLHKDNIPGKPDIVFSKYKTVVFVHGCFWHQHAGCRHSHIPKSNLSYWVPKLQRTTLRDQTIFERLKELGWHVIVVWECEISDKKLTDVYYEITHHARP